MLGPDTRQFLDFRAGLQIQVNFFYEKGSSFSISWIWILDLELKILGKNPLNKIFKTVINTKKNQIESRNRVRIHTKSSRKNTELTGSGSSNPPRMSAQDQVTIKRIRQGKVHQIARWEWIVLTRGDYLLPSPSKPKVYHTGF